jgi:hypothetical protein
MHMLTQYSPGVLPRCPCSRHSDSDHAHESYEGLTPDDPQPSSAGTLTHANIAEHNRQLHSADVAKDAGTGKVTRLTRAAQSLGIDIAEIVEEGVKDMGGTLPMERFLAEKAQSTFAKLIEEKKDENKGCT